MKYYTILNAKKDLPVRKKNSNKSTFGRLLIIAGRPGFWGAGILSARAALKMGCGYVYWSSFYNSEKHILKLPEVLTPNLSDIKKFKEFDAVLIGPGLGVSIKTQYLLKKLLSHKKVVVDADALTVLSKMNLKVPKSWVLTPHPGEMARLLKTSVLEVQKNRLFSVETAQKKWGCTVLLKGFGSLVSEKKSVQIKSGNESLSKAGSGDVLSGMIASLCAQNMDSFKATCLASFAHGYTADLWIQKFTSHSLNPSDIIDLLPKTLREIQRYKRVKTGK